MGTQLDTSLGAAAPKFSRYRSVRRAAAETQNQWAGEASAAKSSNTAIARSMSRYHRPKTTATPALPTAVNLPPVPTLPPSAPVPQAVSRSPKEAIVPNSISKASQNPERVQPAHSQPARRPQSSDQDDDDQLSEAEKVRLREEAMKKLTMAERPKTSSQAADSSENNKQANMGPRVAAPAGVDAPVSAVNAGERRVLVKCKSSSIKLPVTPTTRIKDIIYSAANCFSERIDPASAIIVESFTSLGLERPLRRYEHVRDIMNSWSADNVNALIISESPYDGATQKLELQGAPSAQRKDAQFYLYHSSKPGKWDKRYVTLRADGQIVLSKKSDAKEAKDITNICHMSDFDIYTPTGRQLSKSLRPPKKICFGIKSQQKSSMFLSTENFVRFFATNDSTLAQDFHDAVHGWRSWYLVHVLEVGQKQSETADVDTSKLTGSRDGPSSSARARHLSTDSNPYQLGSFKPLVEFGRNADPAAVAPEKSSDEYNATTRDMFLRKKIARDHAPPPSAFPVTLPPLDTENKSLSPVDDDSTFSPDSLLGRTYSQRQALQREREAMDGTESDPFLSHGLLKHLSPTSSDPSSQNTLFSNPSSQQNSRSNTVRSHNRPAEGISHSRSNSVRQKPRPLVDLTPTYREPPQHARKGHGVKVDSGVPLVEAATGLEAIPGIPEIPSATTWRRDEALTRPAAAGHDISSSVSVSAHRRANTVKKQHHSHPYSNGISGSSDATPFVPNGLVALSSNKMAHVQATAGIGRGVATGDRNATRPLLDMTPQSEFAEGSLLRNLDKNS